MIPWLLLLGLQATPQLAPVFQDSMVLQRQMRVPIWGTAAPRERVVVRFAGQTKAVSADRRGRWRLDLDPMPASSAGSDLLVQGRTALRDVLVGEVWIAAGQSNMEWPLRSSEHGAEEIRSADRPRLRLLNRTFAGQFVYAKPFDASILSRLTPDNFYGGTWRPSSPESAASFSAIAYTFGKILLEKLDVPVGIVSMSVGGSPTEAWLPRSAAKTQTDLAALFRGDWLANPALDEWYVKRGRENLGEAMQAGARLHGDDLGPNHPFKPGFLYDAGIKTLAPMAFQGVIWYQGETNALNLRRVQQHEKIFPALVSSWRSSWGRRFPFYYCQLSGIGTEGGYQSHFWPEFRDQQRRFLSQIPSVGMAVTSDAGHPTDVHPRNKRVVGERLARLALARNYGQKLEDSGPMPRSAYAISSGASVVEFDHADGGLQASGGPLRGFEVAGTDGKYSVATAEIQRHSVVLTCPAVPNPRRVRYGWRPFTDANLVNIDGLPASTFQIAVGPQRHRLTSRARRDSAMVFSQLPTIPNPEGFAAPFAGVSDGRLLVAGGANFPEKRPWEGGKKVWYDDVYALDQPTGRWRTIGKLPRRLGYGVSATYRNRLVCVAGSDTERHYADAFSLEIIGGSLSICSLPPLPVPMANGCGALVGDTLYVAGGQERADSATALDTVFAMDLRADAPRWRTVAGFPGEGRILATAAAFDGSFWVIGGTSLAPDGKGGAKRTYLRDAYRYDATGGWRRVADLPHPVVAAPSPAPADKDGIFILGGDDGSKVGTDPTLHSGFLTEVLRYDARNDRWVGVGEMPVGRVTVPTAFWKGLWVMPNGEKRPGVRSPEVWSLRL